MKIISIEIVIKYSQIFIKFSLVALKYKFKTLYANLLTVILYRYYDTVRFQDWGIEVFVYLNIDQVRVIISDVGRVIIPFWTKVLKYQILILMNHWLWILEDINGLRMLQKPMVVWSNIAIFGQLWLDHIPRH